MFSSRTLRGILLIAVGSLGLDAQTLLDLKHQTKNVDFSEASFTLPVKTGVSPPATCQIGEMFFETDVVPGTNILLCTSTNVWSAPAGSGWQSMLAGPSGALEVTTFGGDSSIDIVSAVLPTKAAVNTFTGLNTFDLGLILSPRTTPGTPSDGQMWYDLAAGKLRCQEGGATKDCITLGAPADAEYLTLSASGALDAERVITPRDGISYLDEGAGAAYYLQLRPDPTVLHVVEEFLSGGSQSGQLGQLGWELLSDGGTGSNSTVAESHHWGIYELNGGTVSGGNAMVRIGAADGSLAGAFDVSDLGSLEWETHVVFRLDHTLDSGGFRVAFQQEDDDTTSGGRIALSGSSLAVNWQYELCADDTTCTTVDSGLAVDTGWHRIKMFRRSGDTANTVRFCMDSCASDVQVSAGFPVATNHMDFFAYLYNTDVPAAENQVKLDYFSMFVRGISRW